MLELMDYWIGQGKVATAAAFCELVGIARQNIPNIRRGHQSFSRDHILSACIATGANANWIFGLEKDMFRVAARKSAVKSAPAKPRATR